MKKSEAYKIAMFAVMGYDAIGKENKLDVLKILIDEEKFALYSEKCEEEEKC